MPKSETNNNKTKTSLVKNLVEYKKAWYGMLCLEIISDLEKARVFDSVPYNWRNEKRDLIVMVSPKQFLFSFWEDAFHEMVIPFTSGEG